MGTNNMDLTDELRHMLAWRGIRYQVPNSAMGLVRTAYNVDGWDVSVDTVCDEYLEVEMERCVDTPEEAIAATLGSKGIAEIADDASRLRAENEQLRKLARGLYYCHDERKCSHCSLQYDDGIPDVINGPRCLRMMDNLGIEVDE